MNPPIDPSTQYSQLKSAVLGGQQTGGGLDIVGNSPELSRIYGLGGLTSTDDAATGKIAGESYNLQVQDANAKRAAAAAQQAQQDMLDPSKYQKIADNNGGYQYFAPNGQPISADRYAQIKGISIDDALKGSQNPIDRSFTQDYKQLNQYLQDKVNSKGAMSATDPKNTKKVDIGDVGALRRAQAVEAQIKQIYPNIDLAKQNPAEVYQTFIQAYPTVFGLHTTGRQGTGYFLPSSDATKNYNPGTSSGIGQ